LTAVGRVPALVIYAMLWGLAVEGADRLLGDPFEPLDVISLAVQICLAILLWPLFLNVWGSRSGR
jgi:hypothetical protein